MENKTSKTPNKNSRRDFLKKAGKAAVVAPAAGLILNASQVHAQRVLPPSGTCDIGCFPDT